MADVLGSTQRGRFVPAGQAVNEVAYVPQKMRAADIEFPAPPPMTFLDLVQLHRLVSPLKFNCPHCHTWTDVPSSLEALRGLRDAYLAHLQDQWDKAYAENPAVQRNAEREARADEERRAERREEQREALERQRRAEAKFHELMTVGGLTPEQARDVMREQFGSDDW